MGFEQCVDMIRLHKAMKLSKYQQAIIDWTKTGIGNGCCNAVAGSGKSTTLRLAAIALQESGVSPSEVKVIVFGKANSQDLIAKFGSEWRESISTLHSAGFSLIKQEIGIRNSREVRVSTNKYKKIAQDLEYIDSRRDKGLLKRRDALAQDSDFTKLIDLVRLTNQQPVAEVIKDLCYHFEMPDVWEFSIVAAAIADCLSAGEAQAQKKEGFDFTDQIWLPVKWELGKKRWFKPYKFVLVDECQDLNAAQLELSLSLAGSSGRLLYVGDPRQAIMGFAGADNRSYHKIVERTKAKELPLSICYRCPRSHIELVLKIYPSIPLEPHEAAPEGKITQITEQELDKHLHTGDMIISRKTAPLVSWCIKLISRGIAATVKGRAIGEQIKSELEQISKMPGFRYENFNDAVNTYRMIKIQRYQNLDNEEQLIETLNDKLTALTTIYKSNPQATSIAHLESYIDDLFSDEHSPITLSTCHRAKGLEGNRLFIIKPDDLPMRWRNQLDWQKEQEDNLLYVALTRSKSELFIVGNPDWLNLAQNQPETSDTPEKQSEELSPLPESPLDQTIYEPDEDYSEDVFEENENGLQLSSLTNIEKVLVRLNLKDKCKLLTFLEDLVNQEKWDLATKALEDDASRSDRAIAALTHTSAPFVAKIRRTMNSQGILEPEDTRIDQRGRRHKPPSSNCKQQKKGNDHYV